MLPDIYIHTLIWAFGLAIIFGAIASKASFCTMGAVSDWINIGDLNRMRCWMLAIATAVLGVGLLEYMNVLDMSLTVSNETSNPPYRVANFVWLRYLLGGLMFGVGMTLGSGCGNKNLIRLGEGSMKALLVLVVMGITAWFMLFTNFSYFGFLQWMAPLGIDFSLQGIPSQDLAAVLFGLAQVEWSDAYRLVIALLVALPLAFWALRASDFRRNLELLAAGIVIGLVIVVAWWVTAGPRGQELLDELAFMDQRPFFAGAQSFTFIGPTGHAVQYLKEGFSPIYLTIGLAMLTGVVVGAFVYTLIFRKLRIEWFVSWSDFFRHLAGGVLMGIGGVLGMGCTIGQGITGVSTLALGSFLTLVSIIAGSAATMKYQYYLMMREPG
ncbi:MAG: YeeE/YedE family protein [Gammaproteobacteria bacterium]|jgi:hypothetical protein